MAGSGKRKDAPTGAQQDHQRKKKVGNGGKWTTPHQQAKLAISQGQSVQPGDVGIWVTCARGQEKKAAREVTSLFDEYAESLYGVKRKSDDDVAGGVDETDDIESAIEKEVQAMKSGAKDDDAGRPFSLVKMNVTCLIFAKTQAPIEPVELVRRICQDARSCTDPSKIKGRYLNRFSPSTEIGKATENGLLETARKTLAPYFDISGTAPKAEAKSGGASQGVENTEKSSSSAPAPAAGADEAGDDKTTEATTEEKAEPGDAKPTDTSSAGGENGKHYSFAIRPTLRNHTTLKMRAVIDSIAGLINQGRHKVNLETPDKVILVDIFQNVCGMSVVDGDWKELKKYNVTELYNEATGKTKHP